MSSVISTTRDEQRNRKAREAAFKTVAAQSTTVEPTAIIEYRSHGRLLIIGPENAALAIAGELMDRLECVVLTTGKGLPEAAQGIPVLYTQGQSVTVEGHLGRYRVENGDGNCARQIDPDNDDFDLVLDLQSPALLDIAVKPFGYYAPEGDATALTRMIEELPTMIGTFEKPRFFNYNPNICAHGIKGNEACRRCIDVCPTGAITSLTERIEVNPYWCQGGGICAATCPTGALTYAFPNPADLLDRVRELLWAYRAAGGIQPVLLFHDAEQGRTRLESLSDYLPDHVLPLEVEELGSVGMDSWLAALAYGAGGILLLWTEALPAQVRSELETQRSFASAILQAMHFPAAAIRWWKNENGLPSKALTHPVMPPGLEPATFASMNEKRNMLYFAINHLYTQSRGAPAIAELPKGAPFGEIVVDREACTLCLACASVCPAKALADGADRPSLRFYETNCVQCGLCAVACPESAIQLHARIIFDPALRTGARSLNEEKPFCCVRCNKPFSTASMINRMLDQLSDHWMFQDDQARERLKMCEDCRVIDMLEADNAKA